ncbi:MAG: sensor histidine kinase [Gammaproteobacteria bacterium]
MLDSEVPKLRTSEKALNALLDSAPDAMVVSDETGRIIMTNLQTEAIFGYRREELLGQPVEILIPRRLARGHAEHRASFMADMKTRPMGIGLELFGLHKDGHEVPVEVSLSPVHLDGGLVVFSAIRNIAEKQNAAREISALNEQLKKHNNDLEAINRELEAFCYSVSHDLRAPLRAIDGLSQALLEDYENRLDDTGQDYLRRVRAAAQRMGVLIDDLLRLSRVNRGTLCHEAVDLSDLAAKIIQDFRNMEPNRQVAVRIEPGLVVNGDRHLLGIAIQNLLSNAWKFTAKSDNARIDFARESKNNEEIFRICDTGVGFDMAYADKLFGAFQRLHDARDFPGTGIGLATVQRIIRRHGGRIWAQAVEGRGATFYFTLGS